MYPQTQPQPCAPPAVPAHLLGAVAAAPAGTVRPRPAAALLRRVQRARRDGRRVPHHPERRHRHVRAVPGGAGRRSTAEPHRRVVEPRLAAGVQLAGAGRQPQSPHRTGPPRRGRAAGAGRAVNGPVTQPAPTRRRNLPPPVSREPGVRPLRWARRRSARLTFPLTFNSRQVLRNDRPAETRTVRLGRRALPRRRRRCVWRRLGRRRRIALHIE